MKTLHKTIRNSALLVLIISFNLVNAQMANTRNFASEEIETKIKPISTLVSFTAQLYNKTVYLKWLVNGQKEDCTYIIQRSANDIDFKTIGYVKGTGAPINVNLLSCFKDTKPLSSKAYYRIATITNLGELLHTQSQIVENTNSIDMQELTLVKN